MNHHLNIRSLVLGLTLTACAACNSAPETPEPPPAPPGELTAGPWTRAFLEPANLIADVIVIEGPPALRKHFSVRQDSKTADYSAETTPKGFLQSMVAKPNTGFVEIHATLDRWQIVALRELRWLERPATAPVVIRAMGGAVFQKVDGGETRRDELLEFRGDVPR